MTEEDINIQHMRAMGLDPSLLGKKFEKPTPRFSNTIAAFGCESCKIGKHHQCLRAIGLSTREGDVRPYCRCYSARSNEHEELIGMIVAALPKEDDAPDREEIVARVAAALRGREAEIMHEGWDTGQDGGWVSHTEFDADVAARIAVDALISVNVLHNLE